MVVKMDSDAVMAKMKELCSVLLEQAEYQELRHAVDRFAADEHSVGQYERFLDTHQRMQRKQQMNLEPAETELDDYEREELALYENPVIREFLYAQREFSQLHQQVSSYFTKTVELNRLPEADELKQDGCGCGGNCGCGGTH